MIKQVVFVCVLGLGVGGARAEMCGMVKAVGHVNSAANRQAVLDLIGKQNETRFSTCDTEDLRAGLPFVKMVLGDLQAKGVKADDAQVVKLTQLAVTMQTVLDELNAPPTEACRELPDGVEGF